MIQYKLPISILLVFMLSACAVVSGLGNRIRGSGVVKTETRQASGFDGVSVCCGMRLSLTQGQQVSLEIEAEDNILPEIVSTVENGILTIRFKDQTGGAWISATKPILVRVSAVKIHSLEVSGGGSADTGPIETDRMAIDLSGGSRAQFGTLKSGSLKVDISGGGKLTAQDLKASQLTLDLSGGSNADITAFQGDAFRLNLSGGGKTNLAGNAKDQTLSLDGGASLQAGDLQSQTARIEMSGGGTSVIWVTESLDATLSGGSNVEYYGRPRITQDLSGGSKLISRGEK